ncbi:hypothetical protein GLYMA_01G055700v4 [Glycine max]|nr:hypothetical protein GYH30_000580 [Glycine max]KRH74996.1 hypothetical protein GLYMA_01G055700v4 [Glycine max]
MSFLACWCCSFKNMKGMVKEFHVPNNEDQTTEQNQFQWLYGNGLLGIIFSFGLLYTALKSRRTRSWLYRD